MLIYSLFSKITKLDDCYEMVTPEGIVVRIEKSEISTANTTKIDEMIAEVAAEAIAKIKAIMQGADVSELPQHVNQITIYKDYCKVVPKVGEEFKIYANEIPEKSLSKLDSLMAYPDYPNTKFGEDCYKVLRDLGTKDVVDVSKNTGIPVDKISRVKNHLFIEEHLVPKQGGLLTKNQYFDADDEIARIWLYATKNDITKYEKLKIWFEQIANHEYQESILMEKMPYLDDWDAKAGRFVGGAHYKAAETAPTPSRDLVDLMKELGLIN